MICDGFYDDGPTVTLRWFMMIWDGFCGGPVVVCNGLG